MSKLRELFRKDMDMTSGNLLAKLFVFSLPIAFTLVLQMLYQSIDLISVRLWGGGDNSVGAIAANGSLVYLITVVFTNMSLGASVAITNAKGAGNKLKAEKVLDTSIIIAFVAGILVGLIGFFLSDNFLRLMKTEEQYMAKATEYLQIYFMGLPFLMIYNYASGDMRAIGDSKTPFIILAVSGAINVLFDFLFVRYLHLDVAGVGYATILSEFISALASVIVLFLYKKSYINLSLKKFKVDKESLIEILKLGLPAGLQGFFFALPNVFIQAKLYTIEPGNLELSNGAIAAGQVENYIYAGVYGIFSACMSFIAENYGANKKENIKKVYWYSMLLNLIYTSLVVVIVGTLYSPLMHIFINSDSAVEYGKYRLYICGMTYLLDGIMDINSATLRGMRKSNFPMINTLVFCTVIRIIFVETLFNIPELHTLTWLYAIMPISWTLSSISSSIALKILLPKAYVEMEEYARSNKVKTA